MVKILEYKLMLKLDISEICYIKLRLNSYNLLTNKGAKKATSETYRPDGKSKKVPESWEPTFEKWQY